jgi:hypothetical protein
MLKTLSQKQRHTSGTKLFYKWKNITALCQLKDRVKVKWKNCVVLKYLQKLSMTHSYVKMFRLISCDISTF